MGTGRLDGKVALITGGASGMGRATAQRFVAEGCKVMIADLQGEVAAELAADLGSAAASVPCNVVEEDAVRTAVEATANRWGRLDVAFANAGFVGVTGPMRNISQKDYDKTMNVLLRGVFFVLKHASPIMAEQRSGSLIATSSVCGVQTGLGTHIYSAAKAGVISLMKSMALEMAEYSVRANTICPGFIATSLVANRARSQASDEEIEARLINARSQLERAQPLRRMGEGEDIASMALFLASDESRWVTGTTNVVDGGWLAGTPWRDQLSQITEARPIAMYDV